jgi:hypothetical protein
VDYSKSDLDLRFGYVINSESGRVYIDAEAGRPNNTRFVDMSDLAGWNHSSYFFSTIRRDGYETIYIPKYKPKFTDIIRRALAPRQCKKTGTGAPA